MSEFDHCPKCGYYQEITNKEVTEVYGTHGVYMIIKHQKCVLCKYGFNVTEKRRVKIDNPPIKGRR